MSAGVPLDAADDVSPADLAVQVWLRAPDLLERRHAEQFLRNPKSFDHFSTADPDAGVYRTEFGRHVFGGPNSFTGGAKYTLEPLRADGEASLACADVAGIVSVRLRELQFHWGGTRHHYTVERADDVFAVLRERGGGRMPATPELAKAVFLVQFAGAARPRTVAVRPPNTAVYARDEDSDLIEAWLHQRGFLDVRDAADGPSGDPLLACA